jgi:hypothetical protein
MRRIGVGLVLGLCMLGPVSGNVGAGAASLTKAEVANRGVHKYREGVKSYGTCSSSTVPGSVDKYRVTFAGTTKVRITPLATPTGAAWYVRLRPNVWERKDPNGFRALVTFSTRGFVLKSWNSGKPCLRYTRTLVE